MIDELRSTIAAQHGALEEKEALIVQLEQALDARGLGALALAESRQATIVQLVDEKKAQQQRIAELEAQLTATLATIERMVEDHVTG